MNPLPSLAGDGGFVYPTDDIALADRNGTTEHRDLSEIAATDSGAGGLAGITINRTKHGTSPFLPIVKTPTYAKNSGNLTGYAVEVEDPRSPTGFRHLGNVSAGYLLLPNEDVRRLALEVAAESGLPFRESRIFWDGARFCHVIDFLQSDHVAEQDEVGLALITRSSYDRSWRYECALMGKRFVCDNGVLSGEFFARVSFKHLQASPRAGDGPIGIDPATSGHQASWEDLVKQGLAVIDRAPEHLDRFVRGLRLLKVASLTDTHLRRVWQLFPNIGDSIKGQIMSRYVEAEEPSLYGFLNAGTHVLWHREKMTAADFSHNDTFATGLLGYAFEHLS